ncbi:hypothetical protein Hanom_Chr06g00540501 [Helianthus anomalus]
MGDNALRAAISCKDASSSFLENLLNLIEIDDHRESLRVLSNALLFAIMPGNRSWSTKPHICYSMSNLGGPPAFMIGLSFSRPQPSTLTEPFFYYLFEACKEYIGLTHVSGCCNPFKGIDVHRLLASTI